LPIKNAAGEKGHISDILKEWMEEMKEK